MVGSRTIQVASRGVRLAVLLGVVAIGCRADRTEWRAALEAQHASRLVGLWSVELNRDPAFGDTLPPRQTLGELALTLNEGRLSAPEVSTPPVYFGTYDIDFASIGVLTGLRKGVPAVAGILEEADTLVLRLIAESPREIELRGVVLGDSVIGRWRAYQPRGIDAAGDFVLRRR